MSAVTLQTLRADLNGLSTRRDCDRALGIVGNNLHYRYEDLTDHRNRKLSARELKAEITRLKSVKAQVLAIKRMLPKPSDGAIDPRVSA